MRSPQQNNSPHMDHRFSARRDREPSIFFDKNNVDMRLYAVRPFDKTCFRGNSKMGFYLRAKRALGRDLTPSEVQYTTDVRVLRDVVSRYLSIHGKCSLELDVEASVQAVSVFRQNKVELYGFDEWFKSHPTYKDRS